MSEDRDLFAAEYVLGTLDAAERAEAARLLGADAAFRASVAWWERRLAPLMSASAPVAPAAELWARVEAGLAAHPAQTPHRRLADGAAAAANDNVAQLARSRARWRVASLATGALAAALALFVVDRELLRPPAQTFVAAVNRGGDLPAMLVRVDLATRAVTVRPVETDTPAGKSLELWYIAAGAAPQSMGVVDKARVTGALPAGVPAKDLIFAVTVEPPGGSPNGKPTGPVVYKGALIAE